MKIKQFRNLFPGIQISRYNMAAWQHHRNGSIFFIGREVDAAGQLGEPDVGVLKLFEVDTSGTVVQERLIWKPLFDGINLEDPRALEIDDDQLIIGLTAVLTDKSGKSIPFPAIIKIDSHNTWQQELPPFLVISSFGPGKNITPLDSTTYLFRPEGDHFNHKLLVFSLHGQVPVQISEISFPTDLPWANWRIGTTMAPIWVNDTQALFIIHGVSKEIVDGVEKYVYSLGRAKLSRQNNSFSVRVATEPILTPDDFVDQQGLPLVTELHPELRRVVYACGGLVNRSSRDTLSLYVNVGDKTTFEVGFLLTELYQGLF